MGLPFSLGRVFAPLANSGPRVSTTCRSALVITGDVQRLRLPPRE